MFSTIVNRITSEPKYLLSRALQISLLMVLSGGYFELWGQGVSINSTYSVPNSSAMLDISSGSGANKGLLIPRVDFSQRSGNFNPLLMAAQGMMVYQTDAGTLGEGLYYNTSTTLSPNWVKAGSTGWSVDGNTGTNPASNFLGTTDAQGINFRTNGSNRMSVSSGGYVGIGSTAPGAKLVVGGNGGNIYATDSWIENNIHVQGNENVAGGRGRLRLGTSSNYIGLYAEPNSLGTNNDLILGSSSTIVRIGPGGAGQKLVLPASSGFQMVDNAATYRVLTSDASGNGTWQQLSNIMQVYSASAVRTSIPYSNPGFTDITGLSISINLAQASYVIIRTTGALESQNSGGGWSAAIIALQRNGVSMQEQGIDMIALSPGYTQTNWNIYQTIELPAGTYVFKTVARKYYSSSNDFYAGGTTLPGITNSGHLMVRVIPK